MVIEYEIESKKEDLDLYGLSVTMSERRVTDMSREKAWLALKSEACGFTAERIFSVD